METFKAILDFLGAISWPVAIIIIALMIRREVVAILSVFRERVRDPRQAVVISAEGITMEAVQVMQAQLEVQRANNQQMNELVRRQIISDTALTDNIPDVLYELADEYFKLSISDWRERVNRRNELAQRMAELALEHHVSRDRLAESGNEALILTLAWLAVSFPEPGDAKRLLSTAPRISRLHVRYYMTLSFARLVEDRLVGPEIVGCILETLTRFETGADKYLRERIMQTRALILKFS